MYGSTNEYLIFPVLNLINKELKRSIQSGGFDAILKEATDRGTSITNNSSDTQVNYEGNVLSVLESNDFELELEKNDPEKPNMLTGVSIYYGKTLKQIISLIRQNGKLMFVRASVIRRQPTSEVSSNPYNMSGNDFIEYVFNKRKIIFYIKIRNDETLTQVERDEADSKIILLENRNAELRNLYNISNDMDMPYERLVEYLPNPLGMDRWDFVEYMKNLRILLGEYQPAEDITMERVTVAESANTDYRSTYFIEDGVYNYSELKPYLPNPPGMHGEDYTVFINNKLEWERLKSDKEEWELLRDSETDPAKQQEYQDLIDAATEEQQMLANSNQDLRRKYAAYIGGSITGYNEDDLNELMSYLPKDSSVYEEKVLFKVIISLIYNKEGKLERVTSATEGGGL